MNAFSILSVILAVVSLIIIGIVMLVDESFMLAAMPTVLAATYLDHLGIEKSMRDFLAEGGRVMADKISVNCRSMLTEAITRMSKMFEDKHFVVVSLRPGKDRTLDQNRLWFAMYKRIAEMTQIGDAADARCYCKLHIGVQILLNEDAGFQAEWYRVMRHLPYETKLDMMGECKLFGPDGFPVTSLFNRAQGIAYTDRIVARFVPLGVYFDDLLSQEAA